MWWLKIAAKMVLSRLPISYGLFSRFGLFRHGDMDQADYAIEVVFDHLARAGAGEALHGKVCLELGPGDSLASAVIARSLGAAQTTLVDVGSFAGPQIEPYRKLAAKLAQRGFAAPELDDAQTIADVLDRTHSVYLTRGLESLRAIPTGSIDIIWSQAVLEHVRLDEISAVLAEFHRVLRPSGVMSHRIDYKDHLAASLNNLRFADAVWESGFMANSGFYTNRIRNTEFLRLIRQAGFRLDEVEPALWDRLPLARAKLAHRFRHLEDEDLRTRHVNVVARPLPPAVGSREGEPSCAKRDDTGHARAAT